MIFSGLCMYIVAGAKMRDLGIIVLIGVIGLAGLFATRPYIKERFMTFLNPAENSLGAGYQIQQSLIAIGSGQVFGKGFGQSIQKFNFLPEPIGDSIFAVAAEEFGFVGSITLIFLFIYFAMRGFKIAANVPDSFGMLLTVGLVVLIISQSFMNIAAMLGIIPLSGLPLLFVSHGGTALFFTLFAIGILFNISKHQKTADLSQ
jgi:cell division protein FtsW